jgi:hypothetical protein
MGPPPEEIVLPFITTTTCILFTLLLHSTLHPGIISRAESVGFQYFSPVT